MNIYIYIYVHANRARTVLHVLPLETRSQLSYGICHDNVIRDEEERINKNNKEE